MFIHLLVKVIQPLLHLFARVLFDDFAQLLLVESQLVAHLLLTDTLSNAGFNPLKEVLPINHKENLRQHSCDLQIMQ